MIKKLVVYFIFFLSTLLLSDAFAQPLRVGVSSVGASMSSLWVTKERGFFEKQGLRVDLIYVAGGKAIPALLAGDIGFSVSAGNSFLAAVMGGADLVIIAGLINKMPYQLYVKSTISSPNDLKGKKIAIAAFGVSSDFAARIGLMELGLNPTKDVALIQLGGSASRVSALAAGTVDGTIVSGPPHTTYLEKLGFKQIFDLVRSKEEFQFTGVVVNRKLIQEKPALIDNFLRSIVEGTHFYKNNAAFVEHVLEKNLRLNDKEVLKAGYQFYSDLFEAKPYVTRKGLQFIIEELKRTGQLSKAVDLDKVVDNQFVKKLDDEGLFRRLYR